MKGKVVTRSSIPAGFKPRKRFVKKANMWVKITAKDGKIVHEWSATEPTL